MKPVMIIFLTFLRFKSSIKAMKIAKKIIAEKGIGEITNLKLLGGISN